MRFKGNIWGADLADVQLISKFNKGFRFLLCVVDVFSKYAWVVPLKYKKGITITNASQKILKESNRNPSKIWVDKGREFYNNSFKNGSKIMVLRCTRYIIKENLLLLEDLLDFKD